MAAEGNADRPPRDDAVAREIRFRQAAALRTHVLADAPPELAFVEGSRPSVGQLLERVGEIRHHQPVAGDEAASVRAEDLATRLRVAQDQIENRVEVRLRPIELEPIPRGRDRRLEQAAPRKPRVGPVCGFQAEPPPVGLVDDTAVPLSSTATQNATDGQDTASRT